jgi:hypothetical protein
VTSGPPLGTAIAGGGNTPGGSGVGQGMTIRATWNRAALALSDRSVVVGDARNEDAAWFYPSPKDSAKEITGRVTFWKGVTVEEVA